MKAPAREWPRRSGSATELGVVAHTDDGGGQGVDVLLRHREPEAAVFDHLRRLIAAIADDGRAAPNQVDEPDAPGELGLHVHEVGADAGVGFDEVVAAIFVVDPTLVEEDAAAGEAEAAAEAEHVGQRLPLNRVGGRVLGAEEEELHVGTRARDQRHCLKQRGGVVPVQDAAAPDQDEVVCVNSGDDAFDAALLLQRRLGAHPKGATSMRLRREGSAS